MTILTSPDGVNWTTRTTGSSYDDLYGVAYGNNSFVAVGSSGMIIQSQPLAPLPPEGLKATSMSASRVDLKWTDKSSRETSFKVYRKKGSGAWTLLGITAPNIQTYSDISATGNDSAISHSYYVEACYNSFCLSTGTAVVPFAPTDRQRNPIGQANRSFLERDNSTNETGFEVYMKKGTCSSTGSFTLIDTTPANEETYTVSGLFPKTAYSFKIRAVKKFRRTTRYVWIFKISCLRGGNNAIDRDCWNLARSLSNVRNTF